ncbi:hypothetical protein, partial [Candidatus Avelusimicrobium faecicola]|uniref:hypothetical protein n=1 Tax=Candidatus Avelusimicrobium faecicola TaxID=3416205 RepID=UPI003D1335CD
MTVLYILIALAALAGTFWAGYLLGGKPAQNAQAQNDTLQKELKDAQNRLHSAELEKSTLKAQKAALDDSLTQQKNFFTQIQG